MCWRKQAQTAIVVASLKATDSFIPQNTYQPSTSPMDAIRQRFIQAEQDFISATRSGDKVAEFADRWETLLSDWESCLHEADHTTRRLVDEIAAKIEELAGDFMAFKSQALSLEDDLMNGIEDIFASLTLEDRVVPRGDLDRGELVEVPVPPQPSHDAISPPQWLLRNLHNPYPLPHVQFTAGQTGGSKHTKDWFTKARQRIGWTRLLRDRFAGCRSLAIDAAFRAFVRDDPHNPLDTDLKTAFSAVKSHAELVYGSETTSPPSSPERLRSISPTPSLTFSSGSEDTDDEPCPVLPLEGNFTRSSKRKFSETSDSTSPKRKRFPHYSLFFLHAADILPGPVDSHHPHKQRTSAPQPARRHSYRALENDAFPELTVIVLNPSVLGEWKVAVCTPCQTRSRRLRYPYGLTSTNPSNSQIPLPRAHPNRPRSILTFSIPYLFLRRPFPPSLVSSYKTDQ